MRFKSDPTNGYQIFAVSGINTISFAIDVAGADTTGLLGFAVERTDPADNEQYFMQGYKVFASVIPHPDENTSVSTNEHPVQSLVWDDFTAKPGRTYHYAFQPLKGRARNLDRSTPSIPITVKTEPLFTQGEHDVFFNRGVASSQAFVRRFGNRRPDAMDPDERREAEAWLSRDLDDAILRFIAAAQSNDTLLCCFYEFRYKPVADALQEAVVRGVKVRLIIDAKVNEHTDSRGFHESFPREDNLRMIEAAGLNLGTDLFLRDARKNEIQHNKFMVLLRGAAGPPEEVWTGSTNLSVGGIHGQTNVGHWLRNSAVAAKFRDYWEHLSGNPGGLVGDSAAAVRQKNTAQRRAVELLAHLPADVAAISAGVTPIFSPRTGLDALNLYVALVDNAAKLACITLAFGVGKAFKEQLKDNNPQSHVSFLLLEKKDVPNPRSTQPFIAINASNNVYKAWGSYMREPLHQWARETSAFGLGLNSHVAFIHSKFLLRDPLGDEPIVVTGSANFSEDSTNANDENMLIIRGSRRVADIYFTEFNRLFNHYYFRSIIESLRERGVDLAADDSLFLKEDNSWLAKYGPGTLRQKRVAIFTGMTGFEP